MTPTGEFSDAQLSAFLDEALPAEQLSMIELQLRSDEVLRRRIASIIGRGDAGLHSVGVIWRRQRLSCPDRETWSAYFLGILDTPHADYVRFHLETIGCRYCQANLEDLKSAQAAAVGESTDASATRRQRYFETSAGHLRKP